MEVNERDSEIIEVKDFYLKQKYTSEYRFDKLLAMSDSEEELNFELGGLFQMANESTDYGADRREYDDSVLEFNTLIKLLSIKNNIWKKEVISKYFYWYFDSLDDHDRHFMYLTGDKFLNDLISSIDFEEREKEREEFFKNQSLAIQEWVNIDKIF